MSDNSGVNMNINKNTDADVNTRVNMDNMRAAVFNAITRALTECNQHLSLSVRRHATSCVIDALSTHVPAPHVDASSSLCRGFHWIGQSFASCHRCGKPAWEHVGMAVPRRDVTPFSDNFDDEYWTVRPWSDERREGLRKAYACDVNQGTGGDSHEQ